MRCFYSSDLFLELPSGHPFPMEKFTVSKDMLLSSGVIMAEDIVEIGAASDYVLQRVHSKAYLDDIYHGTLGKKEETRLGLPMVNKLYQRSATEVEATRQACYSALEEGVSAVLAGGTHHAHFAHGEGYCVFNDIAAAVRDLQIQRPGIKIMVVDTDAHQGNGTNSLLMDDPNVFTYSIHVGRNYPSIKTAGSLDVETVRFVEGGDYLDQLFLSLAGALDVFSPDLVLWVSGVDNHKNDRFGQMALSVADMRRRDEVLLGAFLKNRIPVVVLYGGGYNRQAEATAKLHRNTIASAKKIWKQVKGR